MSEVLSIRVPRSLKREIEELKDVVNRKEEIVDFLKRRVKYYRRVMPVKKIHGILMRHPTLTEGSAVQIVREDRDSS